jgi:type VI secretion system secreted protein Hcp
MSGVVVRPSALLKVVLALAVLALVAAATQLMPSQHAFRPLAASAATGGDPIYMQYGTIQGDVTAQGHEHWIELSSLQWGVGRSISSVTVGGAGREASAPHVSEITITKALDSSSPHLFKEALDGEGQTVVIDFVKTATNGQPLVYLEFTLTNTLVSGFSTSSAGDRPTESLSLNFTKVTYKSTTQDGAGTNSSVSVTYDLATQIVS